MRLHKLIPLVAALVLFLMAFAGCNTVAGLFGFGGPTVVDMTTYEYEVWLDDSTDEIAGYASAAYYEGDITAEDIKSFVGKLDLGVIASINAKGYYALLLSNAISAAEKFLRDKGGDPMVFEQRFTLYVEMLSDKLKAVLPAEQPGVSP